ncbi:MAG: hypothetical protein WCO79_00055 [bacterium]
MKNVPNFDLAHQPTKYLADVIRESRAEYARGEVGGSFDGDTLLKRLKKL